MALSQEKKPTDESGQAVVEYLLLLSVIVSAYVGVARYLTTSGFTQKLTTPITGAFAATYRYGDPKAKGPEDGSPDRHPRAENGQDSFRIFINPEFQ
jgi:uncharacterized protein (UPF0333 family)